MNKILLTRIIQLIFHIKSKNNRTIHDNTSIVHKYKGILPKDINEKSEITDIVMKKHS